jgi:hypothetical protein
MAPPIIRCILCDSSSSQAQGWILGCECLLQCVYPSLGFFKNFPDFSRKYSLFSLEPNHLLESSKIFFSNFKYFIWIRASQITSRVSWNFWAFLDSFHALKALSGIFWICLCTENIFRKKKRNQILLGRTHWHDPTTQLTRAPSILAWAATLACRSSPAPAPL